MIQLTNEYAPIRRLMALAQKKELTKLETRIFSQLKFVCSLSELGNGKYDAVISKAEAYLTEQYKTAGAITIEAVSFAEKILAEAADEAKSYQFLCVAHAHIDMNWMWGYDETVATTVDTFRTMLNLMEEYPSFKFSQSQASVYRIIEEHAPDMLEEIKEKVKEGRWEVTASTWVETDKNLPSGESLSRHVLYTKDYLSRLFSLDPNSLEIDFEPDTFGHSKNVPEILSQGNVKYYYHCRGQIGENLLQRWQAPSGAEVLIYTEPFWYNATIDEHISDYVTQLERLTHSKTLLKVYGVGDHGGGPTRRDIERIIEMNSWPVYPSFCFSFLRDYFHAVEKNGRAHLPVINDEINFLCDGCYTSQSRIKAGNRKSEQLLREAEAFSAMSTLRTGNKYPTASYQKAWEKTLFNQFHDIIPGSGVTETREYASGLYQEIFAAAQTNKKIAFRQISDQINTAAYLQDGGDISQSIGEGGGPGFSLCGRGAGKERGYLLWNEDVVARTEVTELVLWDYEGELAYLVVRNHKGEEVPFQVLQKKIGYWGHNFDRILIEATVPAMGYALYIIGQREDLPVTVSFMNDMRVQTPDKFVLENDRMRVELSSVDAAVVSMRHKPSGRELIDETRPTGIFRLIEEAGKKGVTNWDSNMSAWFTGRYQKAESANRKVEMKPLANGPLRWAVQYDTRFENSTLSVVVSLDKGSSNLCYSVDCDWREFGSADCIPALQFYFPLNQPCDNYCYDVPFGVANRAGRDMDLPSNGFVLASTETERVMLMAKTKYAYRCHDNAIALNLLRSSCDPDPTPEIGKHHIEFAVAVAEKDWSNQCCIQHAYQYNHAFSVAPVSAHSGTLPPTDEILTKISGSVAVSSIKLAEDQESLMIRVYETDGKESKVAFQTGFSVQRAVFADITENETAGTVELTGNTVTFSIKPYQMRTIKLFC